MVHIVFKMQSRDDIVPWIWDTIWFYDLGFYDIPHLDVSHPDIIHPHNHHLDFTHPDNPHSDNSNLAHYPPRHYSASQYYQQLFQNILSYLSPHCCHCGTNSMHEWRINRSQLTHFKKKNKSCNFVGLHNVKEMGLLYDCDMARWNYDIHNVRPQSELIQNKSIVIILFMIHIPVDTMQSLQIGIYWLDRKCANLTLICTLRTFWSTKPYKMEICM